MRKLAQITAVSLLSGALVLGATTAGNAAVGSYDGTGVTISGSSRVDCNRQVNAYITVLKARGKGNDIRAVHSCVYNPYSNNYTGRINFRR